MGPASVPGFHRRRAMCAEPAEARRRSRRARHCREIRQEIARLADVSRRSVQRVDTEVVVTDLDMAQERERRGVGRNKGKSTISALLGIEFPVHSSLAYSAMACWTT